MGIYGALSTRLPAQGAVLRPRKYLGQHRELADGGLQAHRNLVRRPDPRCGAETADGRRRGRRGPRHQQCAGRYLEFGDAHQYGDQRLWLFRGEQKSGSSDGKTTFSGGTFYTRRGDFDVDKEGYLVNGAGYYLEGLPIDPSTGNVSGSVPSVIKVSNSFLPAQPTQDRLSAEPAATAAGRGLQGRHRRQRIAEAGRLLPATGPSAVTGTATLTGTNAANTVMAPGQSLTVKVGTTSTTFDFYDSTVGPYTGTNTGIDVKAANTIGNALGQIQTALQAPGGAAALHAGLVAAKCRFRSARISPIRSPSPMARPAWGWSELRRCGARHRHGRDHQRADGDTFLAQSTAGGAVTGYSTNGSPVNVQFRWAKTASAETGGTDTWNLYYLSNSSATGSQPMWTNAGVDYKFGAGRGAESGGDADHHHNLTVNGVSLGNITLEHGTNGITQFSDPNAPPRSRR